MKQRIIRVARVLNVFDYSDDMLCERELKLTVGKGFLV